MTGPQETTLRSMTTPERRRLLGGDDGAQDGDLGDKAPVIGFLLSSHIRRCSLHDFNGGALDGGGLSFERPALGFTILLWPEDFGRETARAMRRGARATPADKIRASRPFNEEGWCLSGPQ